MGHTSRTANQQAAVEVAAAVAIGLDVVDVFRAAHWVEGQAVTHRLCLRLCTKPTDQRAWRS